MSYRFGPAGRPSLQIASAPDWSNVHAGSIVGGGGGSQQHVRFSHGQYDYIVFEGIGGQLTEIPGKRWSGIQVMRDGQDVTRLECRATVAAAKGVGEIDDVLPNGVRDRIEERDERFLMWF